MGDAGSSGSGRDPFCDSAEVRWKFKTRCSWHYTAFRFGYPHKLHHQISSASTMLEITSPGSIHHPRIVKMPDHLDPRKDSKRERNRQRKTKNGLARLPRKRFFRQRAHANPFSDHFLE